MRILGLDTSTAASSAAILQPDGTIVEQTPPVERLAGRPGHARELLPAIDGVMRRAGVTVADLDAIAVGLGPGTFTGLRIGVATARALAKAGGLPVRGVSSLAALAAGLPSGSGLPLIDAKRAEVYGALYDAGSQVWPAFALTVAALARRLADAGTTPFAAGNGSLRFREELEEAGVEVAHPGSPLHVVSAAHLCRLALQIPDSAPERVVPNYLRDPDAAPR
ncbi:MAG TPA: tRNA (adenosine(37)-N6)-threonylcarbamoyltransferase complex dimerization subunit type 1 TsaB [Thermoleophilaceae bacterium]|nr:tRNA (adenosine(37)-N6)-threonylcarbamoyltransferase complex dimerization subunit type 1 TsaB [Thermoleophilaceae bacterium]